jgi:hypothetical protein
MELFHLATSLPFAKVDDEEPSPLFAWTASLSLGTSMSLQIHHSTTRVTD